MMQALSSEEADDFDRENLNEANDWWEELSEDNKRLAHTQLARMYKQKDCSHSWIEITRYEVKIDECIHCELIKR